MLERVYLVRHAHALDAENDAVRPLSRRGRQEVKELAQLLRANEAFQLTAVWHSPLVRARETAEVLLSELGMKATWIERPELEPDEDPGRVATALHHASGSIALFGHEPQMSALASLLVTGRTRPLVFTFHKATMLALEPAGKHWCVLWQLAPELFP